MKSKKKQVFIIVWIAVIVLLAVAAILVGSAPKAETVQETCLLYTSDAADE